MPNANARPMPGSDQANMAAAGLRTFFNIVREWGLKDVEAQRLLAVPATTYKRWKRAPERATLDQDKLERLSYVLGIYKALQILLPRADAAAGWIKRPNAGSPFGGAPPVQRMLSGQVSDLFVVRNWLDAQRG